MDGGCGRGACPAHVCLCAGSSMAVLGSPHGMQNGLDCALAKPHRDTVNESLDLHAVAVPADAHMPQVLSAAQIVDPRQRQVCLCYKEAVGIHTPSMLLPQQNLHLQERAAPGRPAMSATHGSLDCSRMQRPTLARASRPNLAMPGSHQAAPAPCSAHVPLTYLQRSASGIKKR